MDVRDVATAHAQALTVEAAGGKRFTNSGGVFKWQDWSKSHLTPRYFALSLLTARSLLVLAARKIDPSLPAGNTSYVPEKAVHLNRFVGSRARDILGIKYHTMEETSRDSLADFKARGWY